MCLCAVKHRALRLRSAAHDIPCLFAARFSASARAFQRAIFAMLDGNGGTARNPAQALKIAGTFASKAGPRIHQKWEQLRSECVATRRHTISTLL
jgi:hypothetical protein